MKSILKKFILASLVFAILAIPVISSIGKADAYWGRRWGGYRGYVPAPVVVAPNYGGYIPTPAPTYGGYMPAPAPTYGGYMPAPNTGMNNSGNMPAPTQNQ